MIAKILTWFTDSKVSIVAGIAASVVIFFCGYGVASNKYKAEIAEIEKNHALAFAEKTAEYRANESKQMEAVTTAWEEYEKTKAELAKSRATAGNLRIELERMRNAADRNLARLPQTSANPCKHFEERYARCVSLLKEGGSLSVRGSDLASEGAGLLGEVAAKKDAVVKIYGGK